MGEGEWRALGAPHRGFHNAGRDAMRREMGRKAKEVEGAGKCLGVLPKTVFVCPLHCSRHYTQASTTQALEGECHDVCHDSSPSDMDENKQTERQT